MSNFNLQNLVEQDQTVSRQVKNLFLQFWKYLSNADKKILEETFSKKTQLVEKMLAIFERKKSAIENQMSGVFDKILEEEKKIITQI